MMILSGKCQCTGMTETRAERPTPPTLPPLLQNPNPGRPPTYCPPGGPDDQKLSPVTAILLRRKTSDAIFLLFHNVFSGRASTYAAWTVSRIPIYWDLSRDPGERRFRGREHCQTGLLVAGLDTVSLLHRLGERKKTSRRGEALGDT